MNSNILKDYNNTRKKALYSQTRNILFEKMK